MFSLWLVMFNEKVAIPLISVVRFWSRRVDHLSLRNKWTSLSGIGVSLKYTALTCWEQKRDLESTWLQLHSIHHTKEVKNTSATYFSFQNWSLIVNLRCVNKWELSKRIRNLYQLLLWVWNTCKKSLHVKTVCMPYCWHIKNSIFLKIWYLKLACALLFPSGFEMQFILHIQHVIFGESGHLNHKRGTAILFCLDSTKIYMYLKTCLNRVVK